MDNKNEQIKAVFSDEAFVKTLLEAENEEAVQKMLADKGVEMSLGEIELMGELLEAGAQGALNTEALDRIANGGELTEEELEQAAGGLGFLDIFFNHEGVYYERVGDAFNKISKTDAMQKLNKGALNVVMNFEKSGLNKYGVGAVIAGVAAIGGIGYGIYDAVRRRW